jgi:5-methylcytosine-specific restriction endonuclease McrA
MKWLPLRNAKNRSVDYRCHYCGRTDGSETRDHKVPKMFGGTTILENIVLCCKICSRGQEYRAANPDDSRTIAKFDRWLRVMQEA